MSLSVNIMIPTYNQLQYIREAVESALMQDYENLEVIVSDDSPGDETRNILTPFNGSTRFQYHKNPMSLGRVGNYRHLLYQLAKGDWVIMLDGDDYFIDSGYVTKAMELLQKDTSIVLVGAGLKALYQTTGKYDVYTMSDKHFIVEGTEVFRIKKIPYHQTALYLRKLACELDFYRDPSMGSDSESLYRLCLHGKLAYLPELVAVWRLHEQNTTFTRNLRKQIGELKFIDSIYEAASPKLERKVATEWYQYMYNTMSRQLLQLALRSGQHTLVLKILYLFHQYLGMPASIHYLKQFVKGLLPNHAIRKPDLL